MNIGDRVRMLHGNEEGIIKKISGGGRVEVEIEDGFLIPAMKNELVVIHSSEKKFFGEKESIDSAIEQVKISSDTSDEGLYFVFVPINDQQLSLYLVNDSESQFLVHISEVFGTNHRTLFSEKLPSKTAKKFDDRNLKEMNDWPAFLLRFIPIQEKLSPLISPFERKIKIKATQFFKHLGTAPILGKNAYLFGLIKSTKDLDIQALNDDLKTLNPESKPLDIKRPSTSIDLHIEKLVNDPDQMSNSEKLRIQLNEFEKKMDQAIVSGMDQITFIHGVGNGVLRKEIHRKLSQLENIKYFQDTQKDQWGYGATLVRIS